MLAKVATHLRGASHERRRAPEGANCAPAFGGSAAAELANEAASVGVQPVTPAVTDAVDSLLH